MRLATLSHEGLGSFFALQLRNRFVRVTAAAEAFGFSDSEKSKIASTLGYFQNLPQSEKVLRKLLAAISEKPRTISGNAADGFPVLFDAAAVKFLPPIQRPGKFLCIGMNYRDHCVEQNKEIPKVPVVFNKFATSLIGHETAIPLPLGLDTCIDYEAELGFVIGKTAKRVTKRTAMKHVAGYIIVNDVSLRSVQKKEPQWSRAKGFDGSGPCGPCIVTPDEIPDPHALAISCKVNGTVLQKSNTNQLVFNIADLIAHISQAMTLEPGDIVSTGTPGGVGMYRDPQVFLKEGDVVEVAIDRLGVLRNTCAKG